jgi:hypothetical protein
MPPSGVCLRRIGPADAIVIVVAVVSKHEQTFLLANLYTFVTQKGPSTHVIDATSFVTMWGTTIQEEAISYISIYQTLTADKNSKSY